MSDYISEGLMRSLLHSSRIANKNPQDYEARSNIMWTATWALNTLVAKGKSTDWMVHMLGQAVGAFQASFIEQSPYTNDAEQEMKRIAQEGTANAARV